jgi:hypothetical protein
MRNDLESLNPGKLAAQACHVGHAVAGYFRNLEHFTKDPVTSTEVATCNLIKMWKEWESSTSQYFGTTICLAADQRFVESLQAAKEVSFRNDVLVDTIIDPTYPCKIPLEIAKYLNGKLTVPDNIIVRENDAILLRPEMVGGYVFGNKDNPYMSLLLGGLKLYP